MFKNIYQLILENKTIYMFEKKKIRENLWNNCIRNKNKKIIHDLLSLYEEKKSERTITLSLTY